jgi:hypothetical protein
VRKRAGVVPVHGQCVSICPASRGAFFSVEKVSYCGSWPQCPAGDRALLQLYDERRSAVPALP